MSISKSLAAQMTGIEWADFTANYWIGCTRINPVSGAKSGCDICYAATFAERRMGLKWGAGEERKVSTTVAKRLRYLNRVAIKTGIRFSVFMLSLGDWLDAEVSAEIRHGLIDIIEECSGLNILLLTHRPHLAKKLAPSSWMHRLPAHVWPGVTVDHELHGFRWDRLKEVWGYTDRLWVSAEPLASSLKSLDMSSARSIIIGGASNTSDPSWSLEEVWVKDAIEKYGKKVFFKQYGVFRNGKFYGDKKKAGRDFAGELYDATPWPRHRVMLQNIANQQVLSN